MCEQVQQTKSRMTGMITPLLPKESVEKPMLLETEFAPGMHLFIGATGQLSTERPGNGGFRIWKYDSKDDAAAEVRLSLCFPRRTLAARPCCCAPLSRALRRHALALGRQSHGVARHGVARHALRHGALLCRPGLRATSARRYMCVLYTRFWFVKMVTGRHASRRWPWRRAWR